MLILTRKKGEKIKIIQNGQTICEIVLRDGHATLGFEANPAIKILRSELNLNK